MSAALLGGENRVVVTGLPGTGKTLLLDQIARVLRAAGWTVMLRLADAAPPPGQLGSAALLIDEADRLSRESLQQLLATTPGPLVLVGLDVLLSRVTGATQIVLSPLEPDETKDYIAHWLKLTGRSPTQLDAAAIRRTIEISGGVPRLTSTLLSAACWLAETSDETVITVSHIEEAAALRLCFVAGESDVELAEEGRERRNTPLLVALAAGMLVLGAGAYIATRYYPAETERSFGTIHETVARLQTSISEMLSGPAPTTMAAATVAPPVVELPKPAPVQTAPPPAPSPAAPVVEAPKAPATPPAAIALALPPPTVFITRPPKPVEPAADVAPSAAPPTEIAAAPKPDQAPEPVIARAEPAQDTAALPAPPPPPAPIVSSTAQSPAAIVTPTPPIVALPPASSAPAPLPAPIAVTSAAPLEQPRTLPAETISLLVRRGNDMIAIGDVSAARLLFGRAAEAGDADAMVAMGRTFDPTVLAQTSPLFVADPVEAAQWYRRAAASGSKAADELLHRVEAQATR